MQGCFCCDRRVALTCARKKTSRSALSAAVSLLFGELKELCKKNLKNGPEIHCRAK